MDMFELATGLLPPELRILCQKYRDCSVEEIRLRLGRYPTVLFNGHETAFSCEILDKAALNTVLERATGASVHAHMDELANGYLNYKGLRIGFGASAVNKDYGRLFFKDFSSLNIRIPSVFYGDISNIFCALSNEEVAGILIVSPPGGGKTTLLRELIRRISDGGTRISVVDERNEIAAATQGEFSFDIGKHTDVICGMGKKDAAMLLLRGMNPQMIALDEISRREDMDAVYDIAGCGVKIIASIHGSSLTELRKRAMYRELLNEHIFTDFIFIRNTEEGRKYSHMRLNV